MDKEEGQNEVRRGGDQEGLAGDDKWKGKGTRKMSRWRRSPQSLGVGVLCDWGGLGVTGPRGPPHSCPSCWLRWKTSRRGFRASGEKR